MSLSMLGKFTLLGTGLNMSKPRDCFFIRVIQLSTPNGVRGLKSLLQAKADSPTRVLDSSSLRSSE